MTIGGISRFLPGLVLVLALCVCPAKAESDADVLTTQLSKTMAKAKLKSVAVADFLMADGADSTLGWYLADALCESWLTKTEKFRVVDRSELKDTKVSADDLNSPEMMKRLGSVWGAKAIVTGTIETLPDRYILSVSLHRVDDNAVLATESIPVAHTRILDMLNPEGSNSIPRAGTNGVGAPGCVYCPNPSYTDRARKVKANGIVLLSVVISAEGRTDKINVVKHLGYGLTENAINTVSEWRFKPAEKDGQPVAAMAPLEVTFKLY